MIVTATARRTLVRGAAGRDRSTLTLQLLDMIGASWMSQAICVSAELGLPDLLAEGPRSTAALASATQCREHTLVRLLRGLVSLGICNERRDGLFALTPMGALLRRDTGVRSWAIWWGRHLWPVWHNLSYSVRSGRSARTRKTGSAGYGHLADDPEASGIFNASMVELTRLVARQLLHTVDMSGARCIVDVGGGNGELLMTTLRAYPGLRGVLVDLPHAISGARKRLRDAGLAARCELHEGDFFEAVPRGGDVYLLKSVLHNWSDAQAVRILGRCRQAMGPRSRLIVVERMRPARLTTALRERALCRTDLNMLVGLGGQERSRGEFAALLHRAGFRAGRVIPVGPEYFAVCGYPR